MAQMMTDREHIKINREFRADILSISKTYVINRVLPRGRVSGWISGGVRGLHHIWQVSVSIMAPLLWGLLGRKETHRCNTHLPLINNTNEPLQCRLISPGCDLFWLHTTVTTKIEETAVTKFKSQGLVLCTGRIRLMLCLLCHWCSIFISIFTFL